MLLLLLAILFFVPNTQSCFRTRSGPDPCPCPVIQFIDQSGIRNLEYGSYLANRTTTRPNVTVTEFCQIFADVSALETDNHYLMVFRDGAPPIFMKRLSSTTDKTIQLSDITCDKVNNQWMYYGGIVNNLSVAVQSNAGMCECTSNYEIEIDTEVANLTSCDRLEVKCQKNNYGGSACINSVNGYFSLATSDKDSLTVDDMTCVSGQWYLNSAAFKPSFSCYPWTLFYKFPCGCMEIYGLEASTRVYTLANDGAFADYTLTTGTANYTGCSAELRCAADETLVIFSANFKPLVYSPGTSPVLMCANSPLATNNNQKFWFIDGIMLSDPNFACYGKKAEWLMVARIRVTPSCSNVTGKWTVNEKEYDRLYAICVNYTISA